MKIKIVVKRGLRGRWRWQIRSVHDNPNMVSEYVCGGPPHGFDTEFDAYRAAEAVVGAELERHESLPWWWSRWR